MGNKSRFHPEGRPHWSIAKQSPYGGSGRRLKWSKEHAPLTGDALARVIDAGAQRAAQRKMAKKKRG